MNKLLRGDVVFGNTTSHFLKQIARYFHFSKTILEKIDCHIYIQYKIYLNIVLYNKL